MLKIFEKIYILKIDFVVHFNKILFNEIYSDKRFFNRKFKNDSREECAKMGMEGSNGKGMEGVFLLDSGTAPRGYPCLEV